GRISRSSTHTPPMRENWKICFRSHFKMDTAAAAASLLQQKDTINAHLARSGNPLSGISFPNIFLWQDFFEFKCEMIDDHLCVFAANETGMFLYGPPLAPVISPTVIQRVFALMRDRNRGRPVSRIENVPAERLHEFDPALYARAEKS